MFLVMRSWGREMLDSRVSTSGPRCTRMAFMMRDCGEEKDEVNDDIGVGTHFQLVG